MLGTSVDDLVEFSKGEPNFVSTHYCYIDGPIDGFWGHVGVLCKGSPKTRWYPITKSQKSQIWSRLHDSHVWITARTLNNRMLVINMSNVLCISLLDDASDNPEDWDLDWDAYEGFGDEIYVALDQRLSGDKSYRDTSETLKGVIEDVIKTSELDENQILNRLTFTNIFTVDGRIDSISSYGRYLFDTVFFADMQQLELLEFDDDGHESFYPSGGVALVDMPRQEFLRSYEEVKKEDGIE